MKWPGTSIAELEMIRTSERLLLFLTDRPYVNEFNLEHSALFILFFPPTERDLKCPEKKNEMFVTLNEDNISELGM